MNDISNGFIALIKSCGYRVFVRPSARDTTYCFYTDGTRIGYAQWETFRQSVSTVHMANKQTGTGFHIADEINAKTLKDGLSHSPNWATESDRHSVVKYASMTDYLAASKWNAELVEV